MQHICRRDFGHLHTVTAYGTLASVSGGVSLHTFISIREITSGRCHPPPEKKPIRLEGISTRCKDDVFWGTADLSLLAAVCNYTANPQQLL